MNGNNFTERVRHVLATARQEAGRLRHEFVGTEHLLLGLVHDNAGVAAAVLHSLGTHSEAVRQRVLETISPGTARANSPDLPYTGRGKRALELAINEARQMDHNYVGTEHLLIGVLAEERGVGAQVLVSFGVTLKKVRTEVLRILGMTTEQRATAEEGSGIPPSQSTEVARRVLAGARDEAERLGHGMIEPEHILWSLTREREGGAAVIVERLVADRSALERTTADSLATIPITRAADAVRIPYSPRAQLVLTLARSEARESGDGRVRSHHLLLGVLRERTASYSAAVEAAGLALSAVRVEQDRLLG